MAVVVAVYVFHSHLYLMVVAERSQPVGLQGVFGETLAAGVHIACIGKGSIHHVAVQRLVVGMLSRQRQHVGERNLLALPVCLVLKVQPSVPRMVAVARHPAVVVVAVYGTAGRTAHQRCGVAFDVQLVEVSSEGC